VQYFSDLAEGQEGRERIAAYFRLAVLVPSAYFDLPLVAGLITLLPRSSGRCAVRRCRMWFTIISVGVIPVQAGIRVFQDPVDACFRVNNSPYHLHKDVAPPILPLR
jgi:hypothetical protein